MVAFGMTFVVILLAGHSSFAIVKEAEFFTIGFDQLIAYIIGIIGYERLFRIQHSNRSSPIVKTLEVYVALSAAIVLSFTQSAMQVDGIHFEICTT